MKKVIFMVLLLAVASLGSALPPHIPTFPPQKPTPSLQKPTLPSQKPTLPSQKPAAPPSAVALTAVLDHPVSPQTIEATAKTSDKCAAAIFDIITDPKVLNCLPMDAILPILKIVTDPDLPKNFAKDPAGTFKKVEKPFVQFSNGFCPAPTCSADILGGIVKSLSDNCADDLKTNPTVQMMFAFFVFYPPIHDSICFKNSKSKQYCWDETLTTVVALPKSPIKVVGDPLLDSIAVADCKAICTDCDKDFVNTFFNYIGDPKNPFHDIVVKLLASAGLTDDKLNQLKVAVAVKCGISFEDGKIPDKPGN